MNMCVGLVSPSHSWERLLHAEGVTFAVIPAGETPDVDRFAVIIIDRIPDDSAMRTRLEAYLRQGGALLAYAGHLGDIGGMEVRHEWLGYVVGDGVGVFGTIGLCDIGSGGVIPREANTLRTPSNTFAAFAGPWRGGHMVILPFDPARTMADARHADKNFYSARDRLPSETVSLAGKAVTGQLLHRALEYLFHARGIPYMHLWYFPGGRPNVFAFRIDSDKGTTAQVDTLYDIACDYQVGMSWFLDVGSHESWLSHFRFMTNQEFGVHCYEHVTYPDHERNRRNFGKALHLMRDAGLHPAGVAAPFGTWNEAVAKVQEDLGFAYASEFSWAYDGFPGFAQRDGEDVGALQVPIHPVCIGSLRRVGYRESHMIDYFTMVVEEKLRRDEPLFFYHHPGHAGWEVMRHLFSHVRRCGIESMTLGAFSSWWKARENVAWNASWSGTTIALNVSPSVPESMWFRISRREGGEVVVPPAPEIQLSRLVWTDRPDPPPPRDVRRIRDFDPRGMLGSLFTSFSKRMR